jgi:hypothetical protein
MRPFPSTPAGRLGLFTYAQAISDGWTDKALRCAVNRGSLVRHRPGIFGPPFVQPDDSYVAARRAVATAAIAAVLANPSAAASHTSAAVMHGLPVWYLSALPCITVPPSFVGDVEAAHLHRAQLPPGHLVAGAVRTTDVARTVIDIGREHGVLSAVVAADAALHTGRLGVDTLRAQLLDCRGWPGVLAARRAGDFADERSESPLESASRFKLDGLVPAPDLQASIFDEYGHFLGRTDFLWDEPGVVGEADGMEKYDDAERTSLREEKLRQERFEQAGLVVVRWGSDDLSRIEALVHRIRGAFARAARQTEPRRWRALHRPKAA